MNTTAVFAEDDRKPIERLRRAQLWKIADAYGLTYPPGATKDTMIQLLEGNRVDVTQPMPDVPQVQWETKMVPDASGNKVPQLHPVQPERQGGATTADVHRIVQQQEEERESEEEDSEKEELRTQIRELEDRQARMMDRMEQMMDRFNTPPEPDQESAQEPTQEAEPEPPAEPQPEAETDPQDDSEPESGGETGLAKIARLRKQCKEAGITIVRTDRTADLERKLREAAGDSPGGGNDDEWGV